MSYDRATNYDGSNSKNGLPPNLIKNFNLYEVLEPIKVTQCNEDILLIDLEDSSQVKNEVSVSRPTSSTQEEDDGFSMIDLFQNIYVTPELVSKPTEKAVSNSQSTNIDYEEFLRKLNSKKTSKCTQETFADKKDTRNHQTEWDQMFGNLGLQEQRSGTNNSISNFDFDAAEHEELIDELLDRSLGSLKRSIATEVASNARVLKTPNLQNNTSYDANVVKKDNIKYVHNIASPSQMLYVNDNGLLKKRDTFLLPQTSIKREPVSMDSKSKLNDNLVSDFLKAMECKDIKLKTTQDQPIKHILINAGLQTSVPSHVRYERPNLLSLPLKNKDKLATLKKTVNNPNENDSKFNNDTFKLIKTTTDPEIMAVMPVKAIAKDNKAFAKKCRITSDSGKHNYTKGPDLNEKRVVIPQILDRLGLEKKVNTEKKNIQRRLILDAGSKQSDDGNGKRIEIPVTLEPTVLMEDCNMERMKAFRTSKMLHNFVTEGSILQ